MTEPQQVQTQPQLPDVAAQVDAGFERTVKRYQAAWENRDSPQAVAAIQPQLHPANSFFLTAGSPVHATHCPLCSLSCPTHDALRVHVALTHPNAYCQAPLIGAQPPAPSAPQLAPQVAPHPPQHFAHMTGVPGPRFAPPQQQAVPPVPWMPMPIPPQPVPVVTNSAAMLSQQAQAMKLAQAPMQSPGKVVNPYTPFYCEVCEVQCGAQAQYDSHIEGQKHRKRAEIHKAFLGISKRFPSEGITLVSPNVWACIPCRICLDGKTPVMQHLDTTKHKRNREAMNRRAKAGGPEQGEGTPKSRKRLRTPPTVSATVGIEIAPSRAGPGIGTASPSQPEGNGLVGGGLPGPARAAESGAADASASPNRNEDAAASVHQNVEVTRVPPGIANTIGDDVRGAVRSKKTVMKQVGSQHLEDVKLTEVKLKEVELRDLLPPEVQEDDQGNDGDAPAPTVENVAPGGVMSVLQAAVSLPEFASVPASAGLRSSLSPALAFPPSMAYQLPNPVPKQQKTGRLDSNTGHHMPPSSSPSPACSSDPSENSNSPKHGRRLSSSGKKIHVPPQAKDLRCLVCNVQCNSMDSMNSHLASAKHKRKQLFQECAQASQGSESNTMGTGDSNLFCKICNISCCGRENFQAHLRGKPHAKRLRLNAAQSQQNGA